VGQTLTTGGNHIESPADLDTASATLRRNSLSWPRGLQQNSFCSARLQNHCTRESRKATHLGTPRATWIFVGSAMHHYRCQNVYISSTASERIVDILEFFPHNYQMTQLSSTDRLLMAAKDMKDALQNPHSEVPFARVRDDTILALKLRQTQPPTLPAVPPKVTQRPCPAESSNTILASPMTLPRQTRSQTIIHTQDITNMPLPPRVVTPRKLNPSPLRMPTRSQRLSPCNLSQNDFCGMDTSHIAIALGKNHWSRQHLVNAVIHPVTRKEMEYSDLMKDPRLQPLWT
jgi:hypothetical protein